MVSFSNSILSGEVSNKRPLENGFFPKYKPRRVSAVRDFPPGCGPNAVPINLKSEENGGSEAEAVVANTSGNSLMADVIKPESNEVNTSVMPEVVKDCEVKDSEMPNVVGPSGVKNSDIKDECDESHEAVNVAVDVDMTELLDALVGNITASASVDEKLLVESGALETRLPNEVEYQSHEGIDNHIEVERAESLDMMVGELKTTTNEGLSNGDTLKDMKSDSSNKETGAGDQENLKELNGVDHLASIDEEALLSSLPGSSKTVACVRPKDKYRMRRVFAVRDFPPNCGTNVSLPTDEEKPLITEGNRCLDGPQGNKEITIYSAKENDKDGPPHSAFTSVNESHGEMIVHGLMASENCPWMKEEASIDNSDGGSSAEKVRAQKLSDRKTDRNRGSLILKEDRDYGAYDENMPTPIAMIRDVSDNSDYDNGVSVRKDIVVYSRGKREGKKLPRNVSSSADEVDRKIVHGLMSAQNCPWKKGNTVSSNPVAKTSGGEKSRNVSSSWQKKGQVVAKKSCPKMKSSRFSSKKLKRVLTRDAEESPGALLLADDVDDDEGHTGDFPTKSSPDYESGEVEVTLPPFGPNNSRHGNDRDKVRNTLRFFNAICRKLLQKEEANSTPDDEGKSKRKIKRIDLTAAKILKEKGKEVNAGKQVLGAVPGVVVGDEFQYRVELAVVGIHRLYQAGIDSMKLKNGVLVATSIVSSGAYADDLENNDILLYSGQGGNVVGKQKQQPQDQKLERGNLALKNSIDTRTPVRVIRGWREKAVDPLDPKPKLVTTYVYDGLYTVTKYWTETGPHGKQVFMFELRRNPGQPELAWKQLKKSTNARKRPGVCIPDISGGKEPFAICAVNTINDQKPPKFNYTSKMIYPDRLNLFPPSGCDCIGRCSDSKRCLCAVRNGGQIPYNRNGALVETKLLVYECGPHCKCPPSCYNRVTQRGIRYQLEIFKTESRGWGVRALTSIPSGSFICEYAGELLEDREAEQRIGNDEYLFDIGQNLSDSSQNREDQAISAELVEDGGYTIDACQYGNIGRFVNHSCSPNLYAQNVIYDHNEMKMSHIMLFAMENIPPLQELTYHYNYSVDQIRDSSGNIKVKKCYCGTPECTGRMY